MALNLITHGGTVHDGLAGAPLTAGIGVIGRRITTINHPTAFEPNRPACGTSREAAPVKCFDAIADHHPIRPRHLKRRSIT
jgi:hypothetical protein